MDYGTRKCSDKKKQYVTNLQKLVGQKVQAHGQGAMAKTLVSWELP